MNKNNIAYLKEVLAILEQIVPGHGIDDDWEQTAEYYLNKGTCAANLLRGILEINGAL